jgi:hypothetical protein
MICKKCLKDKNKIEFQTDDSFYCNICIKQDKYLNLLEPMPLIEAVPLNKRKSKLTGLKKLIA